MGLILTTFLIVVAFYMVMSRYETRTTYSVKDVESGKITKIKGSCLDIKYGGKSVHVSMEDDGCYYTTDESEKRKLEDGSVFSVGDKEFQLKVTKHGTGLFVLIPLLLTVATMMALFGQDDILMQQNRLEDEAQKAEEEDRDIESEKVDSSGESKEGKSDSEAADSSGEDEKNTISDQTVSNEQYEERNAAVDGDEDIYKYVKNHEYLVKETVDTDWAFYLDGEEERERAKLLNQPSETGIQISKFHGDIDWEKVKADGIDFAIIQAGSRGTETGVLRADPYFKKNMEGAAENGIKTGVSFHSQALNQKEMDEEITLIMKSIEGYDPAYPIGITLAQDEGDRTLKLSFDEYITLIKYFCIRIKMNGYTPMIMGESGWFSQFSDKHCFDGYLKMIYDANNPPNNFDSCIIWIYRIRYSEAVDGIADNLSVAFSVSSYAAEEK